MRWCAGESSANVGSVQYHVHTLRTPASAHRLYHFYFSVLYIPKVILSVRDFRFIFVYIVFLWLRRRVNNRTEHDTTTQPNEPKRKPYRTALLRPRRCNIG